MFTKMDLKGRQRDGKHCDLCGCSFPAVRCDKCGSQIFCLSCDDMYHRHPKRKFHLRKAVDPQPTPQARPVLPVKISNLTAAPGDPSKMPLPPPRRKKPGKSIFDSFRRASPSSDDGSFSKKDYSWTDRLGSIKKFMSNRPLPPVPANEEENADPESTQSLPLHNLSFIHRRIDEKPPALPQRSQAKPQVPLKDLVNDDLQRNNFMTNGIKNNFGPENQDVHATENFGVHNQQFLSNRFGTLQRQNNSAAFPPSMHPAYPSDKASGMHQSSSATDLASLPGMQGYPHYPYNPHLPPQYPYPYPMYPQFPPYPSHFGSSWANLNSHSQTTDGDFSDHSESSASHVSKGRHRFSKDNKAKRSQSMLMDHMAFQGQFFPYSPYPPGCSPWVPVVSSETPPSPAMARRSSSRASHSRRRRKVTDDDDDDYLSSSPISRPKSSSSEMSRNCQKGRNYSSTESSEEDEGKAQTSSKSKSFEGKKFNKNNFRRRGSSPRLQGLSNASGDEKKGQDIHHRKKSKEKLLSKQHDNSSEKYGIDKPKEAKSTFEETNQNSGKEIIEENSGQYIPLTKWRCQHCTFINNSGERICQVCCRTATKSVSPIEDVSTVKKEIANTVREQIKQEENSQDLCSEKQDMAILNSALDEAEKEINRSLNELLKVQNFAVEGQEPKSVQETFRNQQAINQPASNKETSSTNSSSITAPVKEQTAVYTGNFHAKALLSQNNVVQKSIATGTMETSESLIVSPERVKDSFCQTQTDDGDVSFQNSTQVFSRNTNDSLYASDISKYQLDPTDNIHSRIALTGVEGERLRSGYPGILHRSHSRASLFAGRVNDGFDFGDSNSHGLRAPPMYRSISRASLVGEAEPWSSEYPASQKPKFYLSMEELVERRRQETMRAQGLELVRMIREAEQQGFTADDIQVSINNCGKQNPLVWLQDNWGNIIKTVVSLATNYGKDKAENDVGAVSDNEARDALRLHKGNIWAAVTECVEGRQRKFLELSARGNFTFKEIIEALNASDGDVEAAFAKLTNTSMKPFLMRIWGSGEGVPNLEGAVPQDSSQNCHTGSTDFLNKSRYKDGSNDGSENVSWEDEDYEDDDDIDWKSDEIPNEEEDDEDEEPVTAYQNDLDGTLRPGIGNSRQNTGFFAGDKLLTPESDKSEYCDAFGSGLDERYLSSTSIDEIYLIDAEAKESIDFNLVPKRKSSGLLEKLAAFRIKKANGYAEAVPTENVSCTIDNVVVNSNVSEASKFALSKTSENSNIETAFRPFEAVKQAFGAIKNSVVGTGVKSSVTSPRTVSEKRTIIVRDRIGMEVVSSEKLVEASPVVNSDSYPPEMVKNEPHNDIIENLSIPGGSLMPIFNEFKPDVDFKDSLAEIFILQNSESTSHVSSEFAHPENAENKTVNDSKPVAKHEITEVKSKKMEVNVMESKDFSKDHIQSCEEDMPHTEAATPVTSKETGPSVTATKISKKETSESHAQSEEKISHGFKDNVLHGKSRLQPETETKVISTTNKCQSNRIKVSSEPSSVKHNKENLVTEVEILYKQSNKFPQTIKYLERSSSGYLSHSNNLEIVSVGTERDLEQPSSSVSHLESEKNLKLYQEQNLKRVRHENHVDNEIHVESQIIQNDEAVETKGNKLSLNNFHSNLFENKKLLDSPEQNNSKDFEINANELNQKNEIPPFTLVTSDSENAGMINEVLIESKENSKNHVNFKSELNLTAEIYDKIQTYTNDIVAATDDLVVKISEDFAEGNIITEELQGNSLAEKDQLDIKCDHSDVIDGISTMNQCNETKTRTTLLQSSETSENLVFNVESNHFKDSDFLISEHTDSNVNEFSHKEAEEKQEKHEKSHSCGNVNTCEKLFDSKLEATGGFTGGISSSGNQLPGLSSKYVEENEEVFQKLNAIDKTAINDHPCPHSETDVKENSVPIMNIQPTEHLPETMESVQKIVNSKPDVPLKVEVKEYFPTTTSGSVSNTQFNQQAQVISKLDNFKVVPEKTRSQDTSDNEKINITSADSLLDSKTYVKPKKKKNANLKVTQDISSVENSINNKPEPPEEISNPQISNNESRNLEKLDSIGIETTENPSYLIEKLDTSVLSSTDLKNDSNLFASSGVSDRQSATTDNQKFDLMHSSEKNVEESVSTPSVAIEVEKKFLPDSENESKADVQPPSTSVEISLNSEQKLLKDNSSDDISKVEISYATSEVPEKVQNLDKGKIGSDSMIETLETSTIVHSDILPIDIEKVSKKDSSNAKQFYDAIVTKDSFESTENIEPEFSKSDNAFHDKSESTEDLNSETVTFKTSSAAEGGVDSIDRRQEEFTSSVVSSDVLISSQNDIAADHSDSALDLSSVFTKNIIPSELDMSVRPASPIKPTGLLRRMSFNTRREAIFLERHKDDLSNSVEERPWFVQRKPEPIRQILPKRSIKQQLEFERKVRSLVSDRKCRTYRKAEIVVQLMDLKFDEKEAIHAASECSTFDMALSFLQQECQLCAGKYPAGEIVSMINCPHKACKECIKAYFTIQIRDRTIMELLCPFCNEPDITDEDIAQDYFNHLDIMLKKLVDPDIHELFQRKLRDRVLMKDPNFRWCSQCSSGFIADPNLRKLMCPDCNAITCAGCRRLWEREHEGVSCEAFAEWKDARDPDAQTYSLAKLLTEEGIDCPCCHFRYSLAKGGCMHFKCTQCHHDFCSGCSRPFKMGQRCGVSEFCVKLGLHAHHPRNCLFYLRDKEPNDLERLLDMNNIHYNKDIPLGKDGQIVCQVLEQKETSQGMVDDACGKEVQDGFAGLCRLHYVEYLGQLVNKYKVDPIQIFDNDDLELVLRRASIRLPPKRYRESSEEYRDKLVQLIEEKLPITEMDGS